MSMGLSFPSQLDTLMLQYKSWTVFEVTVKIED